ncbi:MAG: hypothetical protein D8M58_06845 [Calditrichaeota bacterium]|nr:MAG: hypothetical protein DWQ03_19655 [Calditrichota bacterium]MBL1205096.1 hypothetical protein [Calditrichota bacterium]NOG44926.1 hypothetical protein [Calditrichota bacterium]
MIKKLLVFLAIALTYSCSPTDSTDTNNDIPNDPDNIVVPQTEYNNIKPSATFASKSGNKERIVVNLLGLINPSKGLPIDLVADYESGEYNIFLEEDGTLKGIKLEKVNSNNVLKADVVFTVDNSGSMGQEADSIAFGIIKFADFLSSSGLDVQFACVGYSSSINGGVNLTTKEELNHFLESRLYWGFPVTGTARTFGFYGADSAALSAEQQTGYWRSNSSENGTVAVLFADSLYSWRPGAQRVFINFTDEPTQSSTFGEPTWNTQNMCDKILGRASVHTVFSRDSSYYSWSETRERPWEMSLCTGGTSLFIPEDASGLDLTTIPVAGALANSYKIEFLTSAPNDTHSVEITVKDEGADGKIKFKNISY